MGNPFCHCELMTPDVGKAKDFYQKLFTWKLQPMGEGPDPYLLIEVGGHDTGGGMMKCPDPKHPSQWMPYVLVDDVAASTAKALELGAKVCVEKTEIPGIGWFSIITDPTGANLGLFQAARRP